MTNTHPSTPRFMQIDEEGYFHSSGIRIQDEEYGRTLLENIQTVNRGFISKFEDQIIIIEAFDLPYVVHGVTNEDSAWKIQLPYGAQAEFQLESLSLDEQDRFHGRATNGVPFVFSRSAQMQFFDALENFDDDSITFNKKTYVIETLNQLDKRSIEDRPDINTAPFWSEKYLNWTNLKEQPKWELGEVAKPFREILPQIKIPKSRICILGSGSGHDAAYFASQGHIVTGVDISPEAVQLAQQKYPPSANLKFVTADAFDFAKKSRNEFDVIVEHTFFCAVDPDRRKELVHAWQSLLHDQGHLLAIFFLLDRIGGPPFGTTEWEVRSLLQNSFQNLYWTRWKTSIESRLGKELIVYAKKK